MQILEVSKCKLCLVFLPKNRVYVLDENRELTFRRITTVEKNGISYLEENSI